jgi:hypothetical protein
MSRAINLVLDAPTMTRFREIAWRFRAWVRGGVLDRRLDDEIRFHLEQQTEKNLRAGIGLDEARRQALIQFGGGERIRERSRDEFRPALLDDLMRDLRSRAFRLAAVVTLALGIGAVTIIYSMATTSSWIRCRTATPTGS